ncbi:hypothetical protein [Rhodoferax saidenbachensis]|uniref:Uncharacterized protein n=1 Tax=Rhodoferax saidenbachensis TaxID=1484693 RepID=A0A1P8K7X6_9BURK|nr:hypothetical protein [Rhodoferax saidenbachensis]APW42112.1 hypothetical protein RS694_05910 [Rhodoferax saidenbachensis]
MPTTAQTQLDAVQTALEQLRSGALTPHALSDLARSQNVLLDALAPRYAEVLLGLLDRLESSALFSEESCSFSQQGLLDNLQVWVDKARGQLVASAVG